MIDQLIILCIISFFISVVLLKILIHKLPLFGLVDKPSGRRVHIKVTPRGGGIAVVFVLILCSGLFEYYTTKHLIYFIQFAPILITLSAVSLIDDIRHIDVFIRFIIHILCASLAVYNFLYPHLILQQYVPQTVDIFLAIIGLTAFLNIYNFLDGIDGITAVQSIHLSSAILILCFLQKSIIIKVDFVITTATINLGFSIAFLFFNWHPAKIFLGDIGSISLGFTIGLCLLLIAASSLHLVLAVLIVSLYYIADASVTMFIRLINKEIIWTPHLQHFFHKAVTKSGKTQNHVVTTIILCNIFLMIFSIISLYYPFIGFCCAIIISAITLLYLNNENVI